MLRRRIPFTQIAFVTLIGVGGGVYIYRPYFVNRMKTPVEQNQNVAKNESETWLPIILSQSKVGLYNGPLQLEAKLLGTWDMKFIECCQINKCVVFDLRPFNCIFYQVGSGILSRFLLNSFFRNVWGVAAGRGPQRRWLVSESAASTTGNNMYEFKNLRVFSLLWC